MRRFYAAFFLIATACFTSGFQRSVPSELTASAGLLLNKLLETNADPVVKEQKLEITPEGFLRFRKKLQSGKQEYFAFHFSRYRELRYFGSEDRGYAEISVLDSNVIVQTFNDPKGEVDSMATLMRLNLRHCTAEDLSRLALQFSQLKKESTR